MKGSIMHGFELTEKRFVLELNANVMVYKHKKSGAKLIHVDNNDTNKIFSIAFRTPPSDSTGVAHIIEHSVLCGSEKYPLNEPYKELLKGSLYTFLNAMTHKDFTVYPIASTNDKDFKVLSEVCLDAVFYPKLKTIDEIFYQEGWHYEMHNKSDELSIKGVVYNEMLGAFSDPNEVLSFETQKALFPDTVYNNCSDGLPEDIPNLTLQEFRDFHQKYYHPSNSYFFLYGKIDLDDILNMIDQNALSHFNARKLDTTIPLQPLFGFPKEKESVYPILQDDNEDENTWHSLGFLLDLKNDPSRYFSFQVLAHLLFETSGAPLKNALLKAGICEDVMCYFDIDTLQPSFSVTISGSEVKCKEKFKKVFFQTLQKIAKNGIDKQLIEASIAINEFELREATHPVYPKGIVYLLNILPHWIHDFDPIAHLSYEKSVKDAKRGLTTDYFESLIKELLIENKHYTLVTLKPQKGLAEQAHNNLKEKLAKLKKSMSKSEIDNIIQTNKEILKRQTTLDSEEALSKISTLSVNDIDRQTMDFSINIDDEADNNFIFHNHEDFTDGIVYLKMYFDPVYLPKKLIPYAKALTFILGKIHSKNYNNIALSNLINLNTGGIELDFGAYENYKDIYDFKPYFSISSKAMLPNMKSMIDLIKELIQNTLFDDTKQLKEILFEKKAFTEMLLMNLGNMFAHFRLSAYYSNRGRFRESIDGIEYYFFLKDLLKNFNKNSEEIINNFYHAYRFVFNNVRTRVSITAPEQDIKSTQEYLKEQMKDLNHFHADSQAYYFEPLTKNEAFIMPGRVQYIAKGHLNKYTKYNGELDVLEQIISLDYLWNKIRVQGGAYGSSFFFGSKGDVIASSSRDPNLSETLQSIDGIAGYIKKLKLSDKELTKYIIGAIRYYDSPKTPFEKSCLKDLYHFTNRKQDDIQKDRELILDVTPTKLKKYTTMLENVMNQDCYCVFGSEAKIKENNKLFTKVISVF